MTRSASLHTTANLLAYRPPVTRQPRVWTNNAEVRALRRELRLNPPKGSWVSIPPAERWTTETCRWVWDGPIAERLAEIRAAFMQDVWDNRRDEYCRAFLDAQLSVDDVMDCPLERERVS